MSPARKDRAASSPSNYHCLMYRKLMKLGLRFESSDDKDPGTNRTIMKNFVFGMVVGVALLLVVVVGYFLSGSAPVATDAPSMPMEKYLAKKALHAVQDRMRSEEHTSELQSRQYLVCRLLLEKKKIKN